VDGSLGERPVNEPGRGNVRADREPLQELVDSWTEQGVLDSQGRFTMRSDLALQKLRESQLGDPYVYALALFRAIVASGARRVEVDWDLDDLWWNFDGPGLETKLLRRADLPAAFGTAVAKKTWVAA
jgi:hypothetical protein